MANALTPRETEISVLVAEALSNKEIAAMLGISEQTVKNHLVSIYLKLGISSRGHLMIHVLRRNPAEYPHVA